MTKRFANRLWVLLATAALLPTGFCAAQNDADAVLDLRQSIVLALKNNYRVESGKLMAEQDREKVRREQGVYDPKLSVTSGDFRQEYSNGTLPSGSGVMTTGGVSGALPTGTSYSASVTTTELKNTDPAYEQSTSISLSVRQNLLKGFLWNANVAPIRIAAKNASISRLAFERDIANLITEVSYAYFDLILAEQNARVARENMELANRLCEENKQRLALKSIAESDLFQAQSELASRRESLFEAERQLGDARNALRILIADNPQKTIAMSAEAEPLPAPAKVEVNSSDDYARALSLRQDYRQAVLGLQRDQIDALRTSDAALPDVEAFAQGSWYASGKDFRQSYDLARDDYKPDYYAGVSASFDFPNRTARAEKSIARKQVRRSKLTLSDLERQIAVEVDNGARRITCDWDRLITSRESRDLAEKSLQAEQQRYDIGLSSTFVLLRLQTDLTSAQLRELAAENDYRKAVVDYQRIIGATLSDNNVLLP